MLENNKEDNKPLEQVRENELYEIFETQYNDLFCQILLIKEEEFFSLLHKQVSFNLSIIQKTTDNSMLNAFYELFTTRYKENYKLVKENMEILKNKEKNNKEELIYLDYSKCYIHCQKCYDIIHNCGERLIFDKEYIYCIKCNNVYNKEQIIMFCKECNKNYFSKLRKPIFLENKKYEKLFVLKFKKYHCESDKEEKVKCLKCYNNLFYRLNINSPIKEKTISIIYCIKCKLKYNLKEIFFKCKICLKKFKCEVKIYRDFPKKKKILLFIIHSLLNNKNAIPNLSSTEMNCKCDLKNIDKYNHIDDGGLFLQGINNNKKLICNKCYQIFLYQNINWSCPLCKAPFKYKENKKDKNKLFEISNLFQNIVKRKKANSFAKIEGEFQLGNKNENNSDSLEEVEKNIQKKKMAKIGKKYLILNKNKSKNDIFDKNKDSIHSIKKKKKKTVQKIEKLKSEFDKIIPKIDQLENLRVEYSQNNIFENIKYNIYNSEFLESEIENNHHKSKASEKFNKNFPNQKIEKYLLEPVNLDKTNLMMEKFDKVPKPANKIVNVKKKNSFHFISNYFVQNDSNDNHLLNKTNPKYQNYINANHKNKYNLNKIEYDFPKNNSQYTYGNEYYQGINYDNTFYQSFQNYDMSQNFNLFNFNSENYSTIKIIGKGSNGKIYLVKDLQSNQQFALKNILIDNEMELKRKEDEYNLIYKLIYENPTLKVINIYGLEMKRVDKYNIFLNVLMEKGICDWDIEINTRKKKKNFYTEEELFYILTTLVNTLAILQEKGISHRDIKPQNIIYFGKNEYKICDFGEAKYQNYMYEGNNNKVNQTIRGTQLFMSPILYNAVAYKPDSLMLYNSYKSDVFSLGLCFVYACCLSIDPLILIRQTLDMKKLEIIINKNIGSRYSQELIGYLIYMLQIDENNRPDFIELNNWLVYRNRNY